MMAAKLFADASAGLLVYPAVFTPVARASEVSLAKSVLDRIHPLAISPERIDLRVHLLDHMPADETTNAVRLPASCKHGSLQRRTRRPLQKDEDLSSLRPELACCRS